EVYRIHWLRARAEKNCWQEEQELICHEMKWTTRFFMHMAKLWAKRRNNVLEKAGYRSFAERQITLWNELGRVTENLFCQTNVNHVRVWNGVAHLI
ncbi:hypothetical protein CPC08DRAFT_647290, partial [Agrocybe pediades]